MYTAVPSLFSQFAAWPNDVVVREDPDYLPGFNFVHLLPEQTIVHQHMYQDIFTQSRQSGILTLKATCKCVKE